MKSSARIVFLSVMAVICAVWGAPSAGAGEICPMGGVMIEVPVDRDKALSWFSAEGLSYLLIEDDSWTVTTLSSKTKDIAAVWREDSIFYGVADRQQVKVRERTANKAFGSNLAKLRKAVLDEFRQLRKRGVIDIEGSDVARVAAAVGLGTLRKEEGVWVLEASDCQPMTVDVSVIQ